MIWPRGLNIPDFNVHSKANRSQHIVYYRTEPTTKKWKTGKKLKAKTDMIRIGKTSRESVESVQKKKRKATVGKDLQKKEGFKPGMKA